MKKLVLPFLIVLSLLVSACGNGANNTTNNDSNAQNNTQNETSGTVTYESENGPIEVPANPQRIVVLNFSYTGNVLALGAPVVGVESWSAGNANYADYLKDVAVVSEEDVESVLNLDPDLIIAASTTQNLDKFAEIAPTVTYTYGKLDYLAQHVEISKLLGKEAEAQNWVDDFKARAQAAGADIKAKYGDDITVTVFENQAKQLYVFGKNFARGTEILYNEMQLGMTDKVKEVTEANGYFALSTEVLPEYAGDFIVLSNDGSDNSFKETDTYKNIPAVKNRHVIEANATEFYFSDPITLEYQLQLFIDSFLGE